jgi:glutamate-1-semialdehyde aminotransferase
LPLGAVAGRAAVMAARQDGGVNAARTTVTAPAVNPLSVTAGTATLAYLLANRATLYPTLNDAGRSLAEAFNTFARTEQLPVEMRSAGSMFRISFAGGAAAADWTRRVETAFNVLVLNRGVMMLPCHRGFLSAAHESADMNAVREAFTASLRDLRDDGLFARAC